jgi:hypothetical protein
MIGGVQIGRPLFVATGIVFGFIGGFCDGLKAGRE